MLFYNYRYSIKKQQPVGTQFKPHSLQARFVRQWATSWLLLNIFLFVPTIYLVQQNYSIFFHLAHMQAPYLIDHLEREQVWTYGLIVSSIAASFFWGLWLSHRWISRLIHPLSKIQDHLYQLARGRWTTPELTVDDPEIQSVANSYNYFYRSLQIMARQQLELLSLVKVDAKDFDSRQALTRLSTDTSQRLGEPPADPLSAHSSEASTPSPAQRHAS